MQRGIVATVQISRTSGLPFAMVPFLHQSNLLPKGSYGNGEPINVTFVSVQVAHSAVRVRKLPSFSVVYGRQCKFTETRGYLSPWYRVCTTAIFLPKGGYGNGKPKNVTLVLVQLAHFAVRGRKLRTFMQRGIEPTVQIYGNSGLPFAMVPCFHQSNLYTKRKLRERSTQKCDACFGVVSPLRSTGPQATHFHAVRYRADIANLRKLGATFRHGTVLAPKQSLYKKETTGMENQKM